MGFKVYIKLALTLDGVEEGASLLFEGLLEIYKKGEKADLQRNHSTDSSCSFQSPANEHPGYLNDILPGNTSPLHGAEGKFDIYS